MKDRVYTVGDEVTVTRKNKDGHVSVWHGTIVQGDTDRGFCLDGLTAAGEPERSWFSDAEVLLRMYGCEQTVTPSAC